MVRRWLFSHSLSIVMLGAFAVFVTGQAIAGWHVRNEELVQAGVAADSFRSYLGSGHFGEALLENWESEFLQMGAYVLLTAYLVQRGSPESKSLDGKDRPGDDPANATEDSPSWSHRRGWRHLVYRNSLALVLLAFFVLSFVGHLIAGTAAYNEEQKLQTGAPAIGVWQFARTADFWFQSMQNWQSEFFSVGALVLLSIVLRQHGSPQSKPVTAAHDQTGDEPE
ncbi:hypothetical protein HDA40_006826 [Hamadaea flava]|uniref:DUF6766 family protein n=1 Tax=Hamadaea flava TaxID=1742688 RepID=A0ABV8LS94_9ACTN|nr:DUF6766 family protein [Hamadaea flava]MCP2328319.1 hypothetical protein [Hamadaea flava]